ncbi:MAG: 6-pyruvoyl trahydropterin synthase family protein [Halobacteriota archaeon]
MYTVTVAREFIAQHYLTVPNPGSEGDLHSHAYRVELTLFGPELDGYGYLADIDDVTAVVETLLARYQDATLNDLSVFDGANPSVERFARVFCEAFRGESELENPERIRVTMWEDDDANAAYETRL